jgi:hypothetical protein
MNLYEKNFGSVEYDNLVAGTTIPVEIKSVKLKAGQGVLQRGSVLGIISSSKLAVLVDSTATDGSQVADCILTDDVDTGAAGATEDVVATAYTSGLFNRQALIFGGTDTADQHEDTLREKGIFLKDNIPY